MLIVYGLVGACFCLVHDPILFWVWVGVWILLLRVYQIKCRVYLICVVIIAFQGHIPHLNQTFQGVVSARQDDRYTLVGFNQSAIVYTKKPLELDSIVRVTGTFQRSKDLSRRRFQSFYYPRIKVQGTLPSLKRFFWNRLATHPQIRAVFFLNTSDDNVFALSMAWRLTGFLKLIEWLFRPLVGIQNTRRFAKCFLIFYSALVFCNVPIFRVVLKQFMKQEWQIIVLCAMFPRLVISPFFILVYGSFLIENLSHSLRNNQRLYAFLSLSYALNSVNFFQYFFYKLLRLLAGLEFLSALCFGVFPALGQMMSKGLAWPKALVAGAIAHTPTLNGGLWQGVVLLIIWVAAYAPKKAWSLVVASYVLLYYNPLARVTFINVGQGDATLIQAPFHQSSTLIDTGKPSAYYALKKTLLKKGVGHLDVLIVTHDDLDHSGNVENVRRDFLKGRLILDKGIAIPGFKTFLDQHTFKDANANSLILRSHYGVLFTGDAGVLQEFILNHDPTSVSPILKLGHHGSITSSFTPFLKHVQPKLAIVSSTPSVYGHPHKKVMKRLYDLRIPALQTSIEGNITVYFIGNYAFFLTEKGTWGIIS